MPVSCEFVTVDRVCSIEAIYSRDPYCVVDPTCVSPYFSTTRHGAPDVPDWQGMNTIFDAMLVDYNPIRMLAPPNYLLFVGLCIAALYSASRCIRDRVRAQQVIAAIATFCALEFLRWTFIAWATAGRTHESFLSDPTTYVILDAAALPLVLAVTVAWRSRAAKLT